MRGDPSRLDAREFAAITEEPAATKIGGQLSLGEVTA